MSDKSCTSCGKSKAPLNCGLCHASVCKSCAHFMDEGQFSFLPNIPKDLTYTTYCESCYSQHVAGPLDDYNQKLEAAKNVTVFEKKQGKETRLMKRLKDPVFVKDCPDYDEALLRLAFQALLVKCNAVIDVDLRSKKIRENGYQSTLWSGSGMPTNITADQEVKDRSIWDNPN